MAKIKETMTHSKIRRTPTSLFFFVALVCFVALPTVNYAQQKLLPYHQLPDAASAYSAGTVASRMVDGLGFRFYWATEGLRSEDLLFKPGKDARTSRETLEHIYSMSFMILNATTGAINSDEKLDLSFDELRKRTLENFKSASDNLRKSSDDVLKNYAAKFKSGEQLVTRPFWDMISGPIEDCVWHVGQIVTFRRSSGNPLSDRINFFTGTVD
jgi:hypothetical protein